MLAKTTISDVVAVEAEEPNPVPTTTSGLRKVKPYWYPHKTMAKERWWGREILEIVSTEFRDRSMEYYVRIITNLFFFFDIFGADIQI
jgi:hypothetical protein